MADPHTDPVNADDLHRAQGEVAVRWLQLEQAMLYTGRDTGPSRLNAAAHLLSALRHQDHLERRFYRMPCAAGCTYCAPPKP